MERDKELLDLYKKLHDDSTKSWSEKVDLIHKFKRDKNPNYKIGGFTIDPDCNSNAEDLCRDLFELEYMCDRGECKKVDPSEIL